MFIAGNKQWNVQKNWKDFEYTFDSLTQPCSICTSITGSVVVQHTDVVHTQRLRCDATQWRFAHNTQRLCCGITHRCCAQYTTVVLLCNTPMLRTIPAHNGCVVVQHTGVAHKIEHNGSTVQCVVITNRSVRTYELLQHIT